MVPQTDQRPEPHQPTAVNPKIACIHSSAENAPGPEYEPRCRHAVHSSLSRTPRQGSYLLEEDLVVGLLLHLALGPLLLTPGTRMNLSADELKWFGENDPPGTGRAKRVVSPLHNRRHHVHRVSPIAPPARGATPAGPANVPGKRSWTGLPKTPKSNFLPVISPTHLLLGLATGRSLGGLSGLAFRRLRRHDC
jgi:hypothetical protein